MIAGLFRTIGKKEGMCVKMNTEMVKRLYPMPVETIKSLKLKGVKADLPLQDIINAGIHFMDPLDLEDMSDMVMGWKKEFEEKTKELSLQEENKITRKINRELVSSR